jgi:threonine aldolase
MMIDLRSEIVIQPSAAMRQAAATAAVGPDLFGEDPTVDTLEHRTAALLGKEAALFVPTVTMGNLIALKLLGRSGDEVIVESRSHIYGGEIAGISAVCGMMPHPIDGDATGFLPWDSVRRAVRAQTSTRAKTTVLCLENTHNFAGGRVLDHEATVRDCEAARQAGLKIHLDGARLWNAAVASGVRHDELAKPFDSVVVSFSKGLGAPGGAVLTCSADSIQEARRLRRMLGGSMNQPGILAALCLYALEWNYPSLEADHCRAKKLGAVIAARSWALLDVDSIQTNIVIFQPVPQDAGPRIVAALKSKGMLVYPLEDGRIRLVTHLDFTDELLNRAIEICDNVHVH